MLQKVIIVIVFYAVALSNQQTRSRSNLEVVSDLQPKDCYDKNKDYLFDLTTLPKCVDFPKNADEVVSRCSRFNEFKKGSEINYPKLLNKPICDKNLNFEPKQCKGQRTTGRCFCFDKGGKRIFGQEWWKNADNMTCACSRRKAEMAASGNIDGLYYNSLHCNSQGNYEALQCDAVNELCWCADEQTGKLVTPIVPQKAITKLPCYNSLTFGTQYLRQCESRKYAQEKIIDQLKRRGTNTVNFGDFLCDDDGSYGAYSVIDGSAYCVWRDNSKIGTWQYGELDRSSLNCNCARDSKIYSNAGKSFTLTCDGGGNYKSFQQSGNVQFCVDVDGFRTTNDENIPKFDNCSLIYPGYNA